MHIEHGSYEGLLSFSRMCQHWQPWCHWGFVVYGTGHGMYIPVHSVVLNLVAEYWALKEDAITLKYTYTDI